MAIVERPNQDALSRAINLYLDAIRPFLTRNLKKVSGKTVVEALESSLPHDKTVNFAKDFPKADNLESAIEVSHVEHVIREYWGDVFAPHFRNCKGVFAKLKCVAVARNQVAHPPYRRDLDGIVTQEYLDTIEELIGVVGTSEERATVANLKAELKNPEIHRKKALEDFARLEEQYDKTVVELEETQGFLWRVESELEVTNGKLKEEATARRDVEKSEQFAEDSICQVTDELQRELTARKDAEEKADKTETHLTRTVSELDATSTKLKKEKAARREAEKKTQAAQASIRQSKEKLLREVEARREAEKRAAEEAKTSQLFEQTTLEMGTALDLTKKELLASGARLKKLQARIQEMETASQENAVFGQHVYSDKPLNPRTAQYELWLIDEILSGRLDRASLRQLAGDDRLSGRLVYFVQAASSGMDGAAWKGYVAGRHKALLRYGKNSASFANQQRRHLN